MTDKHSRRDFLKRSMSLAVVSAVGPTTLLARIEPVAVQDLNGEIVNGKYRLKVSDFPTQTVGTKKFGLTEVGSSIKLVEFDELLMNPEHCERSGIDGNNYPISVVRVKETGEDAFTAVSTWCPHNNESQLDYFDHTLGESGLFVCTEHEFSSYKSDGTWVPPTESPFKDAPRVGEFHHNIGADGKPHLHSFPVTFDGDDTIEIHDILCNCQECPTSGVEDSDATFSLEQNVPDPVRKLTVVRFVVPSPTKATLTLLSVDGKTVAQPLDRLVEGGEHLVDIDCSELPAGSYFYRLDTKFGTRTRRMRVVH